MKIFVKSLFPFPESFSGQNELCRKNRTLSKEGENNYVYRNEIPPYFYPDFPCGKPLWKNLWRMWKTQGYQQVFRFFAFPQSGAAP